MYQNLLHFLNMLLLYNYAKVVQRLHLLLKILVLENIHSFIFLIISFLSIQIFKELLYPFHLNYDLFPFLLINLLIND